MKLIKFVRTVSCFLAVLLATIALSSCQSEDVSSQSQNNSLVSRVPTALQGVANSDLSVVVQINGNQLYSGEIRDDGTWVVRLTLPELDVDYQYQARWSVRVDNQLIPLMEQSGTFFADASLGQAQVQQMSSLSQGAAYDADCDGQSNLDELTTGNDPLGSNECVSDLPPVNDQGTSVPVNDQGDSVPINNLVISLPEMRAIDAGCFDMGSPDSYEFREDDEVFHQVCIDQEFEIGVFEVTFAQYLDFATAPGTPQAVPSSSLNSTVENPVVMVTRADAVAYTQWLSSMTGDTYRLPTEAEWEYAARAGTTTPFWTGNTIRGDQENFNSEDPHGGGESIGFTWGRVLPVGSLEQNPWGLYDMLGNAGEWTCSGYDEGYENEIETFCVDEAPELVAVRSARHYSLASGARASHRYPTDPTYRDFDLGFRVLRE